MRTILTSFVCVVCIAFTTAVAAQGTGSASMPGPAASGTAPGGGVTGGGAGRVVAPVGHRQPTVGDTAGATQTPEERSAAAEDAKLDRALHSICRGC